MLSPLRRICRIIPVAVAVLAVVLTGCASTHGLSPQTTLSDPDDLHATRSLAPHALNDAAFPTSDWWKTFDDAQLDALIDEALRDSPSLAAADARVRKASARTGLADAERKPTVSGSAQESSVRVPETLAGPPLGGDLQTSTILMLNFKWSPDLWGGERAKYEAAVGQARAAEVEAQAARLMLSTNVARTYIALAEAHAALDVAEREQKRSAHLSELSRQRVAAGLDNELELHQAESEIAAANQQAHAARLQIDGSRNALAALLGKGPDRGLDVTPPQLLRMPIPVVPAVLPSELLGHRADVVAARWRVEAASRAIDAGKAAFKPSVNLNALAGLASSGLSDLFSSDALLAFGGPAISLPIFDGGRLRSNLAERDADYDLAVASYNQSLVDALHEVTDALHAARSLDAQILSAQQAVSAARKAHSLAQTRYQAGLGTQLDVLATQRPLLLYEQKLTVLKAQRLDASVALDTALGGGLDVTPPRVSTRNDSIHPHNAGIRVP